MPDIDFGVGLYIILLFPSNSRYLLIQMGVILKPILMMDTLPGGGLQRSLSLPTFRALINSWHFPRIMAKETLELITKTPEESET